MDGTSARHFAIAWRLALGGLLGCALLQVLLYVRPSPYGGPFLLEWRRYFALALYYDMLGVWLLAFPFLLLWLIRWRHPAEWRWARPVHLIQAAMLAANLALSSFDHEVLRFLGVRLGFSFLATYARPETLSDSLFLDVLADDPGGPFLPLVLLVLAPFLYLWWARRLIRRRLGMAPPRWESRWLALLILVVPLAAPANAWRMATGKFRLRKVEPVVLALAADVALGFGDLGRPTGLDRLARDYQRRWLAESADKAWRFPDRARPYWRVPTGPPPSNPADPGWNVIYLQLETFRGVDMGFLRPPGGPSATPYLDGLARRRDAAAWTRALSFGNPSINGLFAVHCSLPPHSRRYISGFTNVALDCLPQMLRRHGYRTEMFNAGDTDWDNSTYWLTRWYDRLWRYPEAKERDRPAFRAAARRIRAMAAEGRPFLASVVSVSNHTPFRSREPGFDIAGQATPNQRILNTTRYTDDVVREFLEGLRKEPWFARTLVVISGDHGFNLGEHDRRPGQHNLYREALWVPLIVLGPHPRLPRGRDDRLTSLLDVAPTLADLLGLREATSWQGHSLLTRAGPSGFALVTRDMAAAEDAGWSALTDPASGRPRLFDARRDWLQRRDLAPGRAALAEAMLAEARGRMRLNDYLLRHDLVTPR
jgi:sulfatase-like protein